MNRYLASGFGMTLGLLASAGRADDIVWRSARDKSTPPAEANTKSNTPAPTVTAPAVMPSATFATARGTDVTWVRSRAQTDEPVAVLPGEPSLPAQAPTSSPESIAAPKVATPAPTIVMSPVDWLPGNDPWTAPEGVSGRAPRLQVTGEYLFWWIRSQGGPPLLTTAVPGAAGVPGSLPNSVVLLNAGDVAGTYRDGMRFGATYWLDECGSYGFDGRVFFTWNRNDQFQANGANFPNGLFRPFTAANPGLGAFSENVTLPGVTNGRFIAESNSQFWGAEANYRDNLLCRCGCNWMLRADVLAGFRYVNLQESLTLTEDTTRVIPSALFPDEGAGTRIVNQESFRTKNDFYGGQLGTAVEFRRDRLTLDLRGSVALGSTHERLDISGNQVRTLAPSGQVLVLQGGLLALPGANIGDFSRNVFSVVPEIGLNVGYQVTDHLRAFVGYNFLYWSNVLRPGDQIDPVIDVTRVPRFAPPGIPAVFPPRPAPVLNDTDFWAQGVNLGLEFRW